MFLIFVCYVVMLLVVEGLVLWEVLLKCSDFSLLKISCELDLVILVKVINSNIFFVGLYGILVDISFIVFFFEFILFNWISCESNIIADGLVKNVLFVEFVILVDV